MDYKLEIAEEDPEIRKYIEEMMREITVDDKPLIQYLMEIHRNYMENRDKIMRMMENMREVIQKTVETFEELGFQLNGVDGNIEPMVELWEDYDRRLDMNYHFYGVPTEEGFEIYCRLSRDVEEGRNYIGRLLFVYDG